MSAQTFERFEEALREHIADESGGHFLGGYAVVAIRIPQEDNGVTGYTSIAPAGQALHVTEGLLSVGTRMLSDAWTEDE